MIRSTAALVALALAAGARPARADSRAEAIVLFDQGIKDMKAGQLDKACPELAASLELVKDSGTKGALARCHGLSGRLATAWLLWRELADTAPTAELRADAAAQALRLEPRLPRYSIRVASPTPRLVVQINGRTVAVNVPVPVPIDPGAVSVTASERDGNRAVTETWQHEYTLAEGQTVTIDIPALARRPEAGVAPAPPSPRPAEPAPATDRRRTRRVIALSLGGGAVVAAGAGTAFGLAARSKYGDAKDLCGGSVAECLPQAVASSQKRVDAARTSATRSNILFGVSGAAAVAAAIVWITAPSLERKAVTLAPSAAPGALGLAVTGAF